MKAWPVHPAADIFPMLTSEDLDELAHDIAENGLREPVWIWRDPDSGTDYLLDGRNRRAACEKAGIEPRTQRYDGDDPVTLVVSLNVHRRHLNGDQLAMLALKLVPMYEEQGRKAKSRAAAAARRREAEERATQPVQDSLDSRLSCPKPAERQDNSSRSSSRAGAAVGVSRHKIEQAKRITKRDEKLAEKVASGELAADRADRILRDREAEQRRVEQAKAEAAAAGIKATVDIRHGDFRDVLADLTDVDAIITDPPYPREFLPLLADLAAWADKVLAPDGVLVVLMGQTHLPEVYRLLDGGRPYRWTGCYLTTGSGYVSQPRRVQCNWKPLLVYGGGPRFADVIRSEGSDAAAKSNHKWGQDYGAFHTIVERLTKPGQIVVDPFMGSGTTLLAAHALGRNVVGCDIDPEHVDKAKKRLA